MTVLKRFAPIFSGAVTLILFAIIFSLNDIYPFGALTISWCDMDQQTIPLLCDFKDVLSGKRDFWLSMQNAGGMNFFGVYFFNLSSPFTFLVAFFDKADMPLAVNLMVVLKLATASITFSIWLKYIIKKANPIVIICLSVAYAFSGWAMMYYQILSWLDTYYLFPLLLLGLEKLGEGKSPVLYIVSLFLLVVVHFYLAYAVVVFICLYGAVFVLTHKENRYNFAKNFILSSVVSALLSALILIPAFCQYLTSMRSGNIISELSNSAFYPPFQTSLPTFFCLIFAFPFVLKAINLEKLDHLTALFLLTLIPVFIEPIAMAWQTYDYMSFPTRYGFITIALAFTLALKGITSVCEKESENAVKKVNKNQYLMLACSILAVGLSIFFALFSKNYFNKFQEILTCYSRSLWGNNDSLIALVKYYVIPAVFVALVYFAVKHKVVHKIAVYALIAILCVTEAFFGAHVYMVAPANDYAYFARAFELENVIEDDDFFRVKVNAKNYDVNLTGALGYNSLSHYTSLNRESYMIAMKQLGYSSYWMEVNSNGGTVFTDALLRNKYTVVRGSSTSAKYQTENYYVKENDLLFPVAFIIDKNGKNEGDLTKERWQIQDQLFTRLTGISGLHTEYDYAKISGLEDVSEKGVTKLKLTGDSNGTLTYEISVDGTKTFYFDYFNRYSNALRESTYEDISSVSVRNLKKGTRSNFYNFPSQSNNGALCLGTFSNTNLRVEVLVKSNIEGITFGVYSVDNDLLESAVNQSIGGDFKVIKDHLSGKITANENDALFTSFAFDEGYKVKINSKRAQTFSVNGFLAVELVEGVNNIEVDFLPRGLSLALVCFGLGLVTFAVYLLLYKKVQNFKKFEKVLVYLVLALGLLVIIAVYLMPILVNLII